MKKVALLSVVVVLAVSVWFVLSCGKRTEAAQSRSAAALAELKASDSRAATAGSHTSDAPKASSTSPAPEDSTSAPAPKDVITIPKVGDKRSAVTFNHKRHSADYACIKCHHKPKDGVANVSCLACHGKQEVGGTPDARDAFHDTCKGCHKDSVKKNPALEGKAPKECNACHK